MRWRTCLFLSFPRRDFTRCIRLLSSTSSPPSLPSVPCMSHPPKLSPTSSSSSQRPHQRLRNVTSSFTSSPSTAPLRSPLPPPSAMASRSSFTSLPIDDSASYPFGPHRLPGSQLFFLTPLSYASVNRAPVVPGHALVCPRRAVLRVEDMTVDELTDCWTLAQAVGGMLTRHLQAPALTFAIQDGKEAGQSVPHVSATTSLQPCHLHHPHTNSSHPDFATALLDHLLPVVTSTSCPGEPATFLRTTVSHCHSITSSPSHCLP